MTVPKTTFQLDVTLMKRFAKLQEFERKKQQDRRLAKQDFLVRLLNMYEEKVANYEH